MAHLKYSNDFNFNDIFGKLLKVKSNNNIVYFIYIIYDYEIISPIKRDNKVINKYVELLNLMLKKKSPDVLHYDPSPYKVHKISSVQKLLLIYSDSCEHYLIIIF